MDIIRDGTVVICLYLCREGTVGILIWTCPEMGQWVYWLKDVSDAASRKKKKWRDTDVVREDRVRTEQGQSELKANNFVETL